MRRQLVPIFLLAGLVALAGCKSSEERAEEYYQSALSLIEAGDNDRAIVELRNVFDFDGGHIEARKLLAEQLLEHRGDFQRAYSQYLRIAEQYPDDLETRIQLSEMAFEAGNWEEVERHGAMAEELAPDTPRVRILTVARAYREAALSEDAAARRDQARAAEALLAEQPDSLILRNLMIDNHLREGDPRAALSQVDWLIERRPENQVYWRQRLQILAQLGEEELIEAQLREMIDRFPDNDENKAVLLRFLLSRGDVDGAEAYLRERVAETDEPGARVDLIRFLGEVRSVEAAQAEIASAIAEVDNPIPFQVIGAGLDFSTGQQDTAISTLEQILSEADADTDPEMMQGVRISLAKMLQQTGNEVGARARVEEVLAENAGQPDALKMQAAWQIRADDTDAAIASLRLALDSAPEDAEAMTLMAEAYTRAGSPTLARDFLALAVDASGNAPAETIRYARLLIGEERYRPAEDILLPALRLAPQNIDLLQVLGQLYLRMDDMGRAQQVAATLRRIGTAQAIGAANGIEAERLNQQSGPEDAIAYLETIATGQDATIGTKLSLIRAQLATGNLEGARDLAVTLSQENPDNPGITFVLASTEALSGNIETAQNLFRGLVDDDPRRPTVWLELARLAQRGGDGASGAAIIDEGLGHTPDDPNLLWAKASYLERDGDIDGAIEIYDQLYARNSNSSVVANNLASLLSTYREDDESLERAWVIARRFSDAEIPALQDTYGWIAFRRGEPETALPYLESAAVGLPQDALVHYHLARTQEALNQTEAARASYAQVIELAGPGDTRPQIADARDRLSALSEVPAEE